ncbi:MAG: hypothetical protein KDA22_02280, partial [Phycisphaerales bacterium]|nr:hypothetical protein [Phycisphaerales bacterium]
DARPPRSEAERVPPVSAPALRLGLRMVRGLGEEDGRRIEEAVRNHGPFATIDRLHRASGVRAAVLRRLAAADAFGSMGLDRQQATWVVAGLSDGGMELFEAAAEAAPVILPAGAGGDARLRRAAEPISLPAVPPLRAVALDYAAAGVSLRAHPISFIRDQLTRRGVAVNERLRDETAAPSGTRIAVAGLVLVRQRPSTAKGIVFMTLEDETAVANLIVRPKVFQRFRRIARHGVAVLARGTIERQGQVVHVVVRRLEDLGPELADVQSRSRDFH